MRNLLLALSLLIAVNVQAKTQQEVVENVQKYTVLVSDEGFLGGGRGTGILLDEKHVLTCAHMVSSKQDEFFIYTYPFGQVFKAHPEMVDTADDIALLVLETTATVRVRPVFQTKVHDGESIIVVGNALGSMKWFVSKGIISGREQDYLLTDARVNPGNSGGPWVNEAGEIVGITDWGIGPFLHVQGVAGAVSAKTITSVLRQYKSSLSMVAMLMKLFGGTHK